MIRTLIVAGTDTGIGKTVFAAALAGALGATYWKPVQSGLEGETDSETAARLGGLAPAQILPEAYRFALPASPHIAARAEGKAIDPARLTLPAISRQLVVELAGGLLVPLTDNLLTVDQVRRWTQADPGAGIILCASTSLGTINHTLLSIEALRARTIPLVGVAFMGDSAPEAEETIVRFGRVRRLGRLGRLDPLTPQALKTAFAAGFDLAFLAEHAS